MHHVDVGQVLNDKDQQLAGDGRNRGTKASAVAQEVSSSPITRIPTHIIGESLARASLREPLEPASANPRQFLGEFLECPTQSTPQDGSAQPQTITRKSCSAQPQENPWSAELQISRKSLGCPEKYPHPTLEYLQNPWSEQPQSIFKEFSERLNPHTASTLLWGCIGAALGDVATWFGRCSWRGITRQISAPEPVWRLA